MTVENCKWNDPALNAVKNWMSAPIGELSLIGQEALITTGVGKRIDGVVSLNALGWKYRDHLTEICQEEPLARFARRAGQ